jgi:2-oxoglutarate dehydrogenase E1 component
MKVPFNNFPSLLPTCKLSRLQRAFSSAISGGGGGDNFLTGTSGRYVEEMHAAWQSDPQSVPPSWQTYFRTLGNGNDNGNNNGNSNSNGNDGFAFTDYANISNISNTCNINNINNTINTVNSSTLASIQDHLKVQLLVRAFQVRGHLRAQIDPLGIMQPDRDFCAAPELEPSFYGFTAQDLETLNFHLGTGLLPEFQAAQPVMRLADIVDQLRRTYSGTIGYEYAHIPDRQQCNWLRARIEVPQTPSFSREAQLVILDRLMWGVLFEKFVALKYPSEKRFGLEGCESLIPCLKQIVDASVAVGVERVVLGMPHRGRLNVLSNVVRKPNESIFSEFTSGGQALTDTLNYSGDVKYHLGMSYTRPTPSGDFVELSLVANPSHLEAVDPVVQGKVRAIQHFAGDTQQHNRSMALLMHGDASFAGQGVVYETLGMSSLPNYRTGGTIHVIVNNQIGFTTDPRFARSSPYCSDLAKAFAAPIFHVNADDVEAVVHVATLAAQWRREFKSDVVIDLVGYRRHGHNEIDQPAFTQPRMYAKIATKQNVLDIYTAKLLAQQNITQKDLTDMQDRVWGLLESSYAASKTYTPEPFEWQTSKWPGMRGPKEIVSALLPPHPTGIPKDQITRISKIFTAWPQNFTPHPGIEKIMEARKRSLDINEINNDNTSNGNGKSKSKNDNIINTNNTNNTNNTTIDMSTAEALAFGSLLLQNIHVRLGGQDVERGTFSQRHALIHNQNPQEETTFLPLATLGDISICNSHLSEFGALGFELGYSLVNPAALVLWEAQFGDFANNAQCIIDQFIASGERKWLQRSGLVLLLPHGYDGAGPEHSNARMERFLTLCDDDPLVMPSPPGRQIQDCNIQVAYPTTPANYFHLLRRQVMREFRKPLIVFESKSLMRHPLAKSKVQDFLSGTSFLPFIPATNNSADSSVDTLVLCSGQIYYTLERARIANNLHSVAIARVEQLSPFPYDQFLKEIQRFNPKRLVWAQEEPLNLGAWAYIQPRISNALSKQKSTLACEFVGRKPTAAVATGSKKQHIKEELEIISKTLLGHTKQPIKIEIGVPIFF